MGSVRSLGCPLPSEQLWEHSISYVPHLAYAHTSSTYYYGAATAFYSHFTLTRRECAGEFEDANTMCSGSSYAIGSTYLRSLETHDIHTLLGAY
jgi:hypothetical protein